MRRYLKLPSFNLTQLTLSQRVKLSDNPPTNTMAQLAVELSHTTTIDEDGDLTLVVGETKHRIVAASKVLTLVSKVFKAMLSPNFKEGRELAAANGKGYDLELPDDDPEISIVLLNIIHYRPAFSPTEAAKQKRDLDVLRALILLADKYDCVEAIEPVSSRWVAAVAQTRVPGDDALLIIAYLLNDAELFEQVSRRMIQEHGNDFDAMQKAIDPSSRLSSSIFGMFSSQDPGFLQLTSYRIAHETKN